MKHEENLRESERGTKQQAVQYGPESEVAGIALIHPI